MAYRFNEDKLKEYISLSPDDEELLSLEEEYLDGFDVNEVIQAHKQELLDLEDLLGELDTIKKEFDPYLHAREAAENAYSMALYLMYHIARRFHPLSTYGKKMLLRAKKLRAEYEMNFEAPMITGINSENSEAFKKLISPDIMEDLNSGRYKGVGLFKTNVDILVPVAAAVYEWIETPDEYEDRPVIEVKWLLVDEEYRGESYADFLIAELVTLMIEKEASGLNLCVPVDEDYETWLQLFSEWKFSMSTGINPEFRCCLKDIGQKSTLAANMEGAVCFNEMNPDRIDSVIRNYLKSVDSLELFSRYAAKGDYYDSDLSCFTGKENAPTGLLLAHVRPSGVIEIEYMDHNTDFDSGELPLISTCLYNAGMKFDKKTEIILYPDDEVLEEFLDGIVVKQRVIPTIDASLFPPVGADLTEEDTLELVKTV